MRWLVLSVAVLVLAVAGSAQAEAILDQSFEPSPINLSSGVGGTDKAQTFTVGLGGTLSRVDVLIQDNDTGGNVLFDVRATSGGVPIESDATVLASAVIANADLPSTYQFVSVDISSFDVSVAPNDVLAIVLRGNLGETTVAAWGGQDGNQYTGGQQYYRNPGGGVTTWTAIAGTDLGFKTFVVIPEPSTLVLLGMGAVGLLAHAWRRRKPAM